jgi:hypothetical protein
MAIHMVPFPLGNNHQRSAQLRALPTMTRRRCRVRPRARVRKPRSRMCLQRWDGPVGKCVEGRRMRRVVDGMKEGKEGAARQLLAVQTSGACESQNPRRRRVHLVDGAEMEPCIAS